MLIAFCFTFRVFCGFLKYLAKFWQCNMIAPFWAIGLPKEKFTMVDRKLKMLKTDVHFHFDLRVLPAVC
jgi:hypothetical protein